MAGKPFREWILIWISYEKVLRRIMCFLRAHFNVVTSPLCSSYLWESGVTCMKKMNWDFTRFFYLLARSGDHPAPELLMGIIWIKEKKENMYLGTPLNSIPSWTNIRLFQLPMSDLLQIYGTFEFSYQSSFKNGGQGLVPRYLLSKLSNLVSLQFAYTWPA